MTDKKDLMGRTAPGEIAATSGSSAVDAFLGDAKRLSPTIEGRPRGRLVFALDATMSRQPTWDLACQLQGDMFEAASQIGGLSVQLVYFRGFDECRASRWVVEPAALTAMMSQIDVRGGHTQIIRVLRHLRTETAKIPVNAFVLVGDAVEEPLDEICALAGELGLLGVKGFLFHEGKDPAAMQGFQEMARLTNGAYAHFDIGAPQVLAGLLRAAAVYASGGHEALERLAWSEDAARRLLSVMGSR